MTATADSITRTDDTGRKLRARVALETTVALKMHLNHPYATQHVDPAVIDALRTLSDGLTVVAVQWEVWGRPKGDTGPMRRINAAHISSEGAARQYADDLALTDWVYDVRPVLTLRITEDPA